MDFKLSVQEEAFRTELRGWLDKNAPELPEWWKDPKVKGPEPGSKEYHEFQLWWHRKLYAAGYVGIAWPKEFGGRGATLMEQVVFNQEMARARAPETFNGHGIGWCGPVIMRYGQDWQKKRFLPKILTAEEIWCTLYSEPQSGSDMAAAQCRAVIDGDDFVVNGQKVWTSGGHYADWGVLLARTDPNVAKHKGLSYMICCMHYPGVTVRPLRQISGQAEYNEVFFDNVRIPRNQLIGELNRGWYVAAGALEFERSGTGAAERALNTANDLIKLSHDQKRNGKAVSADPRIRQKIAQIYIEAFIMRYNGFRGLTNQLRGLGPGPEISIGKLYRSEHNQRAEELAMELMGPYSQLMRDSKYAIDNGEWQNSFLSARGGTIAAGTSEIQRNVIAQRVLGLPR